MVKHKLGEMCSNPSEILKNLKQIDTILSRFGWLSWLSPAVRYALLANSRLEQPAASEYIYQEN